MGIYDREYYQEGELRPLRPWDNQSMVIMLIIANAALFLANFVFSPRTDDVSLLLSLRPEDLWQPLYWWRLISYGFVHNDIQHIFFNMLSLYFLGRSVEDRLGKWEFLRFYLIALLLCGLVWCGLHAGKQQILLGASGATTAVTMLFVFFFPQANLLLMMAIPVKAWMVGVLIIVLNLFTPNMADGVAYDVHLVGAGLAAAYFFGGFNFRFFETGWADLKTKLRQRRRGMKVVRPNRNSDSISARDSRDDRESDRILDKIHREGQDSLTPAERKFLEKYSRQVRQRRGN